MANEVNNAPRGRMLRGMVARGRTVVAATGEKRVGGYAQDGKAIMAPVLKTFGPHQEVELPEAEIVALRKSGHLVDPDALAEMPAEGARVSEQAPRGVVGFVGQEARG